MRHHYLVSRVEPIDFLDEDWYSLPLLKFAFCLTFTTLLPANRYQFRHGYLFAFYLFLFFMGYLTYLQEILAEFLSFFAQEDAPKEIG